MKPRSQLVLPIRDRRSRRRILTLKNFAKAGAVLVVIFILLSFDWNRPDAKDYGRLLARQVTPAEPAKTATPVIREAEVQDQTAADPLLVAPAAREQELGVNVTMPPRTQTVAPAAVASAYQPEVIAPAASGTKGVVIVGDENGVAIVKSKAAPRPVLSGGIFKQ
jgi:hypothetical protein